MSVELDPFARVCALLQRELGARQLTPDDLGMVHLHVPAGRVTPHLVGSIKAVVNAHPGSRPVYLHVGATLMLLPVNVNDGAVEAFRMLLGPNGVTVR